MKNTIVMLIMPVIAALTVSAGELPIPRADPEPFFSEYVEGAASKAPGDLALEIFNPTNFPIELGNMSYVIEIYADGALTPTAVISLVGTIPPQGTYVVVASGADPILLALADQVEPLLVFDGNDLIVLRGLLQAKAPADRQLTILDAIGQLGNDPTPPGYWGACPLCTADVDLRRDPTVLYGDISLSDAYDVASGWLANPPDDWTDLGSHVPVPVELMSFSIE